MSPAKCLITGAGGFVGQALAKSLLSEPSISEIILTDVFEPPRPHLEGSEKPVRCVSADLTAIASIESVFDPLVEYHFLLHGIMSGQAESDFALGMKVNLDSTRLILDHLRTKNPGTNVVYTSSTAVYGPSSDPNRVIDEEVAPDPQSSYGAQKNIVEILVNDYSRRGFVDGRIVRLPTVSCSSPLPSYLLDILCECWKWMIMLKRLEIGYCEAGKTNGRCIIFRLGNLQRALEWRESNSSCFERPQPVGLFPKDGCKKFDHSE